MLLQAEYLISFLTHKTDEVRNKIAYYLADNKFKNSEIISQSIKALIYFGTEINVPIINLLKIQDLSSDNIDQLFKIYEEISNKREFANSRYFLTELFLEQPIDLLKEAVQFPVIFIDQIEKRRNNNKHRDFENQIKYHIIDELWVKLNNFIESNFDKCINEVDLNYGRLLIEKMLSYEHTKYDSIIKHYFESCKSYQPWLKWYSYAYAASIFNLQDCFHNIIKCYQYDETFQMLSLINPIIMENINQEHLSFIKNEFISGNKDYQTSLCSILEKMVYEETEILILELINYAKDDLVKLNLCIALDDIFSLEFIHIAQDLVNVGYDRHVINLEEELLLFSIISGKEISDVGEYADEYLKRNTNNKINEVKYKNGDYSPMVENLNNQIKIMKTSNTKIGRNVPCPCGSGRKFKHCCIDKY